MSPLADAVLREGVDDWVPFRTVHMLAHAESPDAEELSLRQSAIDAVCALVLAGLVEIGTVDDGGFAAWSAPLLELSRFTPDYLDGDTATEDDWGFRCWLSNTPSGDERARSAADA
jgi:hypothetical protein